MGVAKMSDYHARIMNVCIGDVGTFDSWGGDLDVLYKRGHRNARHEAAEIALEADAEIDRLSNIVAKLPVTEDGVTVVPGVDPIWINPGEADGWGAIPPQFSSVSHCIKIRFWGRFLGVISAESSHWLGAATWHGKFYSTEQAAKDAAISFPEPSNG